MSLNLLCSHIFLALFPSHSLPPFQPPLFLLAHQPSPLSQVLTVSLHFFRGPEQGLVYSTLSHVSQSHVLSSFGAPEQTPSQVKVKQRGSSETSLHSYIKCSLASPKVHRISWIHLPCEKGKSQNILLIKSYRLDSHTRTVVGNTVNLGLHQLAQNRNIIL